MTVVGTGDWKFARGKSCVKTYRNCSSRVATCRISFSEALPTRKKFFERTLVQESIACAACAAASRHVKAKRVRTRRFMTSFFYDGILRSSPRRGKTRGAETERHAVFDFEAAPDEFKAEFYRPTFARLKR